MRVTSSSSTDRPGAALAFARGLPWRRGVRWLGALTTFIMFVVLLQGTLVTNTGSAEGCGRDWPLCHGRFIPQFAVATFIEFSHRAVVGLATPLILLFTVGVLVFWRARREIQILAPAMVVFLVAQAALGALAVKFPETPAVLALHFGVSLLSFASIALATLFIFEVEGRDRLRDRPTPRGFFWLIWGLVVYTYLVVYSGAYVRHKGVELACDQWPACRNGQVIPTLTQGVGIVLTHRVAALALTVGTLWLFFWARRLRRGRPDLYWGSVVALASVVLQALGGAFVVWSKLDIFSTLAHSAFVALLFGALCYLAMHTLRRPQAVRRAERAERERRGAVKAPAASAQPQVAQS